MWIALVAVYIVWGSTYLAIAVAVETIPPLLMAGARFLIAGGVMLAWAAARGQLRRERIGWPQIGWATVIGGLLLLGGNGGVAWAEQHVDTGIASLIIAAVPLWMAMLAALGGHERIRPATAAGLVVGFLGIALLVQTGGSSGADADPAGLAALVGASVAWAVGSVLSLRVPLPRQPLVATAIEMLGGGLLLVVAGSAVGEFADLDVGSVSAASLGGLLYLITFGSFVGFLAYVWLLQNARTSLVSTYAYVNPVVAVFLGWLLLDERITGMTALGAALILGAVALIVGRRRERPRPLAPAPEPEGATAPTRS